MRLNLCLDAFELIHQLLVDMQAARCIEQHIVITLILGKFNRLTRNFHRVCRALFKHGHTRFFANHLELLDRRRAVNVARHEKRAIPLIFQHQAKLCAIGRFANTLQAAHHHDRRRMWSACKAAACAAHQLCELLVDDFYHHLAGR